LETAEFQKRLKVITMDEFIRREGTADGRLPVPEDKRTAVENAAEHCDNRAKSGMYLFLCAIFLVFVITFVI